MLYNQLLYFQSLFDTERALSAVRGTGRFGESASSSWANVSRGKEGIGNCKPKHAEPTRRSGRQIPRPQWQAIRRHERIVWVHGEDQDLESLYWDPVLYAYGLLLLNETKSSAQLDLTSDQVRQVRNGERVLQTSFDSSLLVLRSRPPAQSFQQVPSDLDISLL